MRRLLAPVLGTLGVLGACVPATEDLDPRGAAGFHLQPSAATRGEPFETQDGYRITIDRLVLLVSLQAGRTDPRTDDESFGDSDWILFDARSPDPIHCPGLPVGEFGLSLLFTEMLIDDTEEPSLAPSARIFLPRFRASPDLSRTYVTTYEPFGYGPSVLVELHAEGHGRRVAASLTLEGSYDFSGEPLGSVRVRANDLTTAPLVIRAEELFIHRPLALCSPYCGPSCVADCTEGCTPRPEAPDECTTFCTGLCENEDSSVEAVPEFEAFARADRDGDGVLTAHELRDARRDEESFQNLGVDLVERTSRLFAKPE